MPRNDPRTILCVRVSDDLRAAITRRHEAIGADTLSDTVRWLLEEAVDIPHEPPTRPPADTLRPAHRQPCDDCPAQET